jgi:hypothetical protein
VRSSLDGWPEIDFGRSVHDSICCPSVCWSAIVNTLPFESWKERG